MPVATMPNPKGQKNQPPATSDDAGGQQPDETGKEKSTLKVDPEDARLVGKIAAHRGKSVAKLFKDKDVQDFFNHLLLEEMRKESERIQGKKKS